MTETSIAAIVGFDRVDELTLQLEAQFGAPVVKLVEIAEPYLGITPLVAMRRASQARLPFKTFKTFDSKKAPHMVLVRDLAKHLVGQSQAAEEIWQQLNSRT